MKNVAVLIPTYNQPEMLTRCLYSILIATKSIYKIYVIDNSIEGYAKQIVKNMGNSNIRVIRTEPKLGWMKAINEGIRISTEKYVLFLNDDTIIPRNDELWLEKMLGMFAKYKDVGAVGATSNNILQLQNIRSLSHPRYLFVPVLSGMCMLVSRKVIEKVGKLDETLSGGDDLDYSLRLRKNGYFLIVESSVFVFHEGCQTYGKIHGSYWNSKEYTDKLNHDLIRKHGLKEFQKLNFFPKEELDKIESKLEKVDYTWEKNAVLPYCNGLGLDIGCGGNKIKDDVIGIDIVPKGDMGIAGGQHGVTCQADILIETVKLPYETNSIDYVCSKHSLEHIVDDVNALQEWVRVLKPNGKLILVLPDEEKCEGLLIDPTHKHTYTIDSLETKLKLICKYKKLHVKQSDISFVLIIEVTK